MQRATPAQAALLRRHIGDPSLSDDGVEELRATIAETEAPEEVEALIGSLTDAALHALDDLPPPSREPLAALAIAATARTV
jgi:geranylgeranyl diphosphate synthase type I